MKIDLKSLKRMLQEQARRLTLDVPPILFEIRDSESDSAKKDTDDDRDTYRTFTLKLNPGEKRSETIEKHVRVFNDGTPKEFVQFRMEFADLEHEIPLTTYEQKYKTVDTLLKGKCRTSFRSRVNDYIRDIDVTEHTPVEVKDLILKTVELALNDVAKDVFATPNAVRRQKYYMRHFLFMTDEMSVRDFTRALREHNDMLKYFPYDKTQRKPKPLPDDELADILNRAKPVRWHLDMLGANIDPYSFSYDDFQDYLERLEVKDSLDRASNKRKASLMDDDASDSDNNDQKRRKTSNNPKSKKDNNKGNGKKNTCKHCGKYGHKDKDCWELEANESRRPKSWKTVKEVSTGFTHEQLNTMLQELPAYKAVMKAAKKPKRRVIDDDDSDDDVQDSNFMQPSNFKSEENTGEANDKYL